MRVTCEGCVWHTVTKTIDMVADEQYTHCCWRDPGGPSVRVVSNDEGYTPPACCERYEG